MKFYFSIFFALFIVACENTSQEKVVLKPIPEETPIHKISTEVLETKEQVLPSITKYPNGTYEVVLGVHQIEYFANRLMLKAKKVGYTNSSKKTFIQNNKTYHKVTLGPFESYQDAKKADLAIKSIVPDLNSTDIKIKK